MYYKFCYQSVEFQQDLSPEQIGLLSSQLPRYGPIQRTAIVTQMQTPKQDLLGDIKRAFLGIQSPVFEESLGKSVIARTLKLTTRDQLADCILEYLTVPNNTLETLKISLPKILHSQLGEAIGVIIQRHIDTQGETRPKPSECYCELPLTSSEAIQCTTCMKLRHTQCMFDTKLLNECPTCLIKKCNPFQQVKSVVVQKTIRATKKQLQFVLNLSNINIQNQVVLRCIRLGKSHKAKICWPRVCYVWINGLKFASFNPLIKRIQGQSKNYAVYIPPTNFLRRTVLKLKLSNKHIKEQQASNPSQEKVYLLGVYVVKNITIPQIVTKTLSRLTDIKEFQTAMKAKYATRTYRGDKLTDRVSMICPLNETRMTIPVRGIRCRHMDCFDLQNFLTICKDSKRFQCQLALCIQECNQFVADPIVYKVIQQDVEEYIDYVEFSQDGHKSHYQGVELIDVEAQNQNQNQNQEVDPLSVSDTTKIPLQRIPFCILSQSPCRKIAPIVLEVQDQVIDNTVTISKTKHIVKRLDICRKQLQQSTPMVVKTCHQNQLQATILRLFPSQNQ